MAHHIFFYFMMANDPDFFGNLGKQFVHSYTSCHPRVKNTIYPTKCFIIAHTKKQ